MRLAIHEIALAEERDEDDVRIDLTWQRFDKLHLRRDVRGSALALADAVDLHEALQDLIVASARASTEQRRSFLGRHPAAVENYMEQVRVIPSVPGSFVLRALLPLDRPPEQDPLPLTGPASPAVRKVSTTILGATENAISAANDVVRGASAERWLEAVPTGVSSNLCDALARLTGSGGTGQGNAELRIDWTWAAPDAPFGAADCAVRTSARFRCG